jgi:hypothetical protein
MNENLFELDTGTGRRRTNTNERGSEKVGD